MLEVLENADSLEEIHRDQDHQNSRKDHLQWLYQARSMVSQRYPGSGNQLRWCVVELAKVGSRRPLNLPNSPKSRPIGSSRED